MKRRNFVQMLAMSGLGAAFPMASGKVKAASLNSSERFFVTISADGGWDTTCLFDPKGTTGDINRVALNNDLVSADGLRWSDVPEINDRELVQNQYKNFFTKYSSQLSVIRGVDAMTTSHVLGMKATWSGNFGSNPAIGALFGAVHGADLPLSYLTFGGAYGGNDYTAGLTVAKARLNGSNLLGQMANPRVGHREDVYDLLKDAHKDRLARLIENESTSNQGLQLRAKKISELLEQRLKPNMFAQLQDNLDQLKTSNSFDGHWHSNRAGLLKDQARIAAASFATGTTSSASLNMPGFDTHGNNYNQYYLLGDLLEGIHYLVEALEFFGVADKTVIMIASDVGRTPKHNGNGKDHYNVTGQMVLHPKFSGKGGNYFGQTTDDYRQLSIDLDTGLPNTDGTRITSRHTLQAMREYLDLSESEQAKPFSLNVPVTPNLFG